MIKTFIAGTVERAVSEQGRLYRYKDSITLGLVAVVWIAAFLLSYVTGLSEVAAGAIGFIGNLAAVIVTRLTPGAITPSMAERLQKQAEKDEYQPKHAAPGNWIDDARHALAKGA